MSFIFDDKKLLNDLLRISGGFNKQAQVADPLPPPANVEQIVNKVFDKAIAAVAPKAESPSEFGIQSHDINVDNLSTLDNFLDSIVHAEGQTIVKEILNTSAPGPKPEGYTLYTAKEAKNAPAYFVNVPKLVAYVNELTKDPLYEKQDTTGRLYKLMLGKLSNEINKAFGLGQGVTGTGDSVIFSFSKSIDVSRAPNENRGDNLLKVSDLNNIGDWIKNNNITINRAGASSQNPVCEFLGYLYLYFSTYRQQIVSAMTAANCPTTPTTTGGAATSTLLSVPGTELPGSTSELAKKLLLAEMREHAPFYKYNIITFNDGKRGIIPFLLKTTNYYYDKNIAAAQESNKLFNEFNEFYTKKIGEEQRTLSESSKPQTYMTYLTDFLEQQARANKNKDVEYLMSLMERLHVFSETLYGNLEVSPNEMNRNYHGEIGIIRNTFTNILESQLQTRSPR